MFLDRDWKSRQGETQYASVEVKLPKLLTARASPVTIIPAPGEGRITIVWAVCFQLKYGSAIFVRPGGDEDLVLRFTGTTGSTVSAATDATFLTQAADSLTWVSPAAASVLARATVANQPIVLHNDGSNELTGGTGSSVVVQVTYTVSQFGT